MIDFQSMNALANEQVISEGLHDLHIKKLEVQEKIRFCYKELKEVLDDISNYIQFYQVQDNAVDAMLKQSNSKKPNKKRADYVG